MGIPELIGALNSRLVDENEKMAVFGQPPS